MSSILAKFRAAFPTRLSMALAIAAALYLIIVLANLGEENSLFRWIFLAALTGLAVLTRFQRTKLKPTAVTVLKWVHLFLAVLYFWGAAFGKWAKRGDPDEGFLSADGGTGFGILAVVLAVALIILAIMRIMGLSKVLPGLGVEQLTVILGAVAWMNILAFVTGWLATFEAGTGWGVVVAYFPASLIPQLGLITLSASEPATGIEPLTTGTRRALSLVAMVAAIGVAAFPFLAYITSGSISLTAMEGKTDGSLSGPRFGYMLLIIGVVVAVAALMRMRPNGLTEPGPNALLSHALLTMGAVAFFVPLAMLISIMRHEAGLSVGIGVWLGLVAGLVLMGVALAENRIRGAVGA